MFGIAIAHVVFFFTAERDARLRQHDFHADNLNSRAIFRFPGVAARLSELTDILSVAGFALYSLCGCNPRKEIAAQTCFRIRIHRVADLCRGGIRCLWQSEQGANESGNDAGNLYGFRHGKLESVAALDECNAHSPVKQIVKR